MISITTQYTEHQDAKFQKFLDKYVQHQDQPYVTVGFHEGAGEYESNTSSSIGFPRTEYKSVVQVALWNEFGATNGISSTPERSFIRSAIDQNEDKINQWRFEILMDIIFNGLSVKAGLEKLGFRVQQLIQSQIKSNIQPPNEAEYAAWKKQQGLGSKTLIATGLMERSVTFQVHEK